MRSYLEQRFSQYLTRERLQWEYEPKQFQIDAFTRYTPDFIVHVADQAVFIELKPTIDHMLDDKRIVRLSNLIDNVCMVVTDLGDGWFGPALGRDWIWRSDLESLEGFVWMISKR